MIRITDVDRLFPGKAVVVCGMYSTDFCYHSVHVVCVGLLYSE
jgi:hypothetical protein